LAFAAFRGLVFLGFREEDGGDLGLLQANCS
jgi:hypothetical protein